MPVNQGQADAAIASGTAFDTLDTIVYRGGSEADMIARLQFRFGGPGRMDYDTAVYIFNLYAQYRNSGLRLDIRTDNSTAGQLKLPKIPGCSQRFEYRVVIPFYDPGVESAFTKPFVINSTTRLGKQDVLERARALAVNFLLTQETLPGGAADENLSYVTGLGHITGAGECTP